MTNTKRKFLPGSEWIYLKLYTGPKASDKILTDYLLPLTQELLADKTIDTWFFIRYADPGHHIRFRMRVTTNEHLGPAMSALHNIISECMNLDLIWNVVSDTYSREFERYVPDAYHAVEIYFRTESEMIVKGIKILEGEEEELRWLFGLKAIDLLLSDFSYNEDSKMVLLEKLKTNFATEFNTNKQLQKQLDTKYRLHKKKLENFIIQDHSNTELAALFNIISAKSEASSDSIKEISECLENERRDNVLGSIIHMLMNRLFRSKNRLHELVLYDMLYRHYKAAWGKRTYSREAIST